MVCMRIWNFVCDTRILIIADGKNCLHNTATSMLFIDMWYGFACGKQYWRTKSRKNIRYTSSNAYDTFHLNAIWKCFNDFVLWIWQMNSHAIFRHFTIFVCGCQRVCVCVCQSCSDWLIWLWIYEVNENPILKRSIITFKLSSFGWHCLLLWIFVFSVF